MMPRESATTYTEDTLEVGGRVYAPTTRRIRSMQLSISSLPTV